MSKIKPNEPCPICGSGKKYKKCCGATASVSKKPKSQPNDPKMEGTWGLSGNGINMHLWRKSSDPNNPMNFANPNGSVGKYKVSFTLSKPNYAPMEENHISFGDDNVGDSHIFIGNSEDFRVEFHTELPEGNFVFYGYSNSKGFISKIEIEEITAQNSKMQL